MTHSAGTWQAEVLEGTPDSRPPLVLLHHPTFGRAMWQPALAGLCVADPGRQVLVLDLPDHDAFNPWPGYDVQGVAAAVHEAVTWTRLNRPVVVGHAMAAVVATVYAARYPTRGVVNVDQWLEASPSVAPGTAQADEIRGGGLTPAWQLFVGVRVQRLMPQARWLLRPPGHGQQDVIAGYRRESLGRLPDSLSVTVQAALAEVREAGIDYLFLAGRDVEPGYRRWLSQILPLAGVEVIPCGGHFPHLACPRRFAACLATTGRWGGGAIECYSNVR